MTEPRFKRGDKVHKDTGDYTFRGWVAMPYTKLISGLQRYVTENHEGNNFIMTDAQLKPGWPQDSIEQSKVPCTGACMSRGCNCHR